MSGEQALSDAQIEAEFDKFFDFPGNDKSFVSSVSARLFAKHVAGLSTPPVQPAQVAEPVRQAGEGMTDEQIEAAVQKAGGRWNGSYWTIEDADLHPLVRSLVATKQAQGSESGEAVAWMRAVQTGVCYGSAEYEAEFSAGSTQPDGEGWDALYTSPGAAVGRAGQRERAEVVCGACKGSGEQMFVVSIGPDSREEPGQCIPCGGTGMLASEGHRDAARLDLLAECLEYVEHGTVRTHDGTGGHWRREAARNLLGRLRLHLVQSDSTAHLRAANDQRDAAYEVVGQVYTMEALVPGGAVRHHAMLSKQLRSGTALYAAIESNRGT